MEDRRLKADDGAFPEGRDLQRFVDRRQRTGQIWKTAFLGATVVGIIALLALLYNVINESFGYVAYQNEIDPATLTLGFYKEQVLAAERTATSEDDAVLVNGIQEHGTAIGFFGYSYYSANQDGLKLLAVDGVRPSAETVASGHYPLTRSLFVYTAESVLLDKPQVASFISHYLEHVNDNPDAHGFFPAPQPLVDESFQTLKSAAGQGIRPAGDVTGGIMVAGSSTVAPLTESAAEAFKAAGFAGIVAVDISGTAAGFDVFCSGKADMVNASRAANRAEILKCRKAGRPLVEFRVGTDGLAVVTSAQNDFVTGLSSAQLQEVFTTGDRWSDIDPSFAQKPILRDIPGAKSGTLDFFVSTVFPSSLEEMPAADKIALLKANISTGRARALAAVKALEARSDAELVRLLTDEVVRPRIAATWTLVDSLFNKPAIEERALQIPHSTLAFRNWVNPTFLASPQSSKPELAGVRTAIMGSLWVTLIAFLFSVPLGVGAAIYLEEYGGRAGLRRASRRTSITSPACRRSSTVCWAWRCSCACSKG
jgi:ABC-type phosphate transport system substrate-binding protein